jgi:transcriptional regulator with XRE-family HTH domain
MARTRHPADRVMEQRIGARIIVLRERRGLTAIALARLAGLHRNTIWRLESGAACSVAALVRVMAVLEIEISDVVPDSPSLVHSWKSAIVEYEKPASLPFGTYT